MREDPWVAMSKHALAKTLLERGHPDDRDRVAELTSDALAIARKLGMATLESRVLALRVYAMSRHGWVVPEPEGPPTGDGRAAVLASAGGGDG